MKTLFLQILIGMQIKVEHSYCCACAIMGPIFPSVSVLVIQQLMTFQRSHSFCCGWLSVNRYYLKILFSNTGQI
jgi:hypothetical protein